LIVFGSSLEATTILYIQSRGRDRSLHANLSACLPVCLDICPSKCLFALSGAVFFKASHWPSGQMISSSPHIGPTAHPTPKKCSFNLGIFQTGSDPPILPSQWRFVFLEDKKDEMNESVGLVENIVCAPVLLCRRAGGSGVVAPRIHFQFYDHPGPLDLLATVVFTSIK
jgi:hypothetical protein